MQTFFLSLLQIEWIFKTLANFLAGTRLKYYGLVYLRYATGILVRLSHTPREPEVYMQSAFMVNQKEL